MHQGSAREFEPNHIGLKISCKCEFSHVAWRETKECGFCTTCMQKSCTVDIGLKTLSLLHIVPTHIGVTHGNWGTWSTYSTCSTTCGAGSQRRSRKCNNPAPSNGGRYCSGLGNQYKKCNTRSCSARRRGGEYMRLGKFPKISLGKLPKMRLREFPIIRLGGFPNFVPTIENC